MKNNNWIWIIIIILALIFIVPNLQKKEHQVGELSYSNPHSTMDDCGTERQDMMNDGVKCVGECVQITTETDNCDESTFSSLIGNYHFLYSDTLLCSDTLIHQQHIPWDCYYGPQQSCNTPADSNCDGCISDIGEWGTAVTNWKTQQGGITDDNWVQIVPKWKSQEGC